MKPFCVQDSKKVMQMQCHILLEYAMNNYTWNEIEWLTVHAGFVCLKVLKCTCIFLYSFTCYVSINQNSCGHLPSETHLPRPTLRSNGILVKDDKYRGLGLQALQRHSLAGTKKTNLFMGRFHVAEVVAQGEEGWHQGDHGHQHQHLDKAEVCTRTGV